MDRPAADSTYGSLLTALSTSLRTLRRIKSSSTAAIDRPLADEEIGEMNGVFVPEQARGERLDQITDLGFGE